MGDMKQHINQYAKNIGSAFSYDDFVHTKLATGGPTLQVHSKAQFKAQRKEVASSNKTVVVVPGTAVYGLFYIALCEQLYQLGLNVVTFDPRGHGESDGARGCYTIAELVEDTIAVISFAIEQYGPEVYLAGSSQGGIVAYYTAAKDDRLKGVVCKNIADLSEAETRDLSRFPWLSRLSFPFLKLGAMFFPKLQLPIGVYLNLQKEKMTYYGCFGDYLKKDPWALKSISIRTLYSLSGEKPNKSFADFTLPILLLQPLSDELFSARFTHKIFCQLGSDHKRIEVIKGRHLVFVESAEDVAAIIGRWISSL